MTVAPSPAGPDRRDGIAYVLDPEVSFAVEVALAASRPLLLRGEPGSGKSSLAAHVARQRNWRYYEQVVTSRTAPRDLLWTFDSVRRLGDAQVRRKGEDLNDASYVGPGALWWAFDHESASRHADDPNAVNEDREVAGAVVLIDEIDKADPDLPNGILVPLGSNEFHVSEIRTTVRRRVENGSLPDLLVVVTTNEERDLPEAFLRRCVVAWLPEPTRDHLLAVAHEHLQANGTPATAADDALAEELANHLMAARNDARREGIRPPSTAEFLDAFRALRQLNIGAGDSRWQQVRALTMVKPRQPR